MRAAVIATICYLELLEGEETDNSAKETALQGALKNTRAAASKADELFQEICKAETMQA
jgi:hypothetical protein